MKGAGNKVVIAFKGGTWANKTDTTHDTYYLYSSMIWVVTHWRMASQYSGVRYIKTSKMTSFAIALSDGMLDSVTAVRDVTSG